ncbi:MAG TPA: serine/threonine protein kinase [Chloroflexi bacterium]|nr:MAG: serine/threonine protein kinase [Chloroflexota bacterium]HDN04333.1 serine/threonine protein kinase [Chloroflexota bacterium]
MTLNQGQLLRDRYRIIEVLGHGGMGSIFRAVDENLGLEVAVKENLFTIDDYARQFRREATILASLRHPHLPRVSDHFTVEDQGQYLIMDYIEGEDLQERLERIGPFEEEEVVYIGAAICDALSYMHSRESVVLHRDIKPANVRITPSGGVFLVDFGLAKVMQGDQTTTTGARAMTMGFSPPEQYGAARTDARTDIYSLGATLYTALTGLTPEDSLAQTMDQEELTPVRERNPRVSKRVSEAVEKALQVHPNNRWQMAAEFKNELLKAQSGRFNINFGFDPTSTAISKKPDPKKPPGVIVRGVETKQITKKRTPRDANASAEKNGTPRQRIKIDRGGCLAFIALLTFILILAGAVFALLNPVFTRNLINLWF